MRAGSSYKTHVALLIVQVAFASQTVEGKIAMSPPAVGGEGINPWALAMVRMAAAAIFFVFLTQTFASRTPTTWRDRLHLAGLSLLGISFNQTLFLVGLRSTKPVSAALLSVTIPIFTAAISVAFRVEKPSWRLGLGLGLALLGVVSLTGLRDIDRGALLVTVNSLSYSAYIVLSRRLIQRLGTMTVLTWVFGCGALAFAPLGLPALVASAPSWSARGWMLVGYIVLMPTIVAYTCNAWALGRSSPTLVTIYIYLQPVLSALLAYFQMGQPLSPALVVAALFIGAGVFVVSISPWRRPQPVPDRA